MLQPLVSFFFFFNDTATTEIYTLSLHDALPISDTQQEKRPSTERIHPRPHQWLAHDPDGAVPAHHDAVGIRSEEHTSELQSLRHLVCRLLLEKKNKNN